MRAPLLLASGLLLGIGATLVFQHVTAKHDRQAMGGSYAGQHTRQVSSFSADDIADLSEGRGWGLARPAELNGYPGPLHVLELADALDLSEAQRAAAADSYRRMQSRARELGQALIAAESGVDDLFRNNRADTGTLNARLAEAEGLRSELRATHLLAHLEVTPVLTAAQRATYARLRGYGHAHGEHAGSHAHD